MQRFVYCYAFLTKENRKKALVTTTGVCACVLSDAPGVVLFRSSPQSQRRLSDLMVGMDVGDVGLGLEGYLDDMIAPELDNMEGIPQQEDALDQRLEAAGDSAFVAMRM